MSVVDKSPYAGTWKLHNRTVVRHTPDCLVYINGYLHIPGCRACNGSIDFQKYITQVSVSPSVNPIANASISMSIPAFASEAFTADGNYLLRAGLFVTIFMRGYFPRTGIAGEGEDTSPADGFDPKKTPVYPYYQVFRGVVTQVSHEYNGGNYSVSMSCSDFLHFWSNLKLATNGSLYGPRPDNSNTQLYLTGHRFTGASPYSIIYSLFRVGFGSTGGVEFTYGRKTSIASVSDVAGQTLSKMAGLNQERLFNSRNVNLRMYGVDGSLYNGFTAAYLGAFASEENKSDDSLNTDLPEYDRTPIEGTPTMKRLARELGFNPLSTIAALSQAGDNNDTPIAVNVLKMQAFILDVSSQGSVNEFETEYATKLEIANQVTEVTGFEFFQDVDGDIVFKPPMYNLNTADDPVYVIEDRDLISMEESDNEPEATYIKGTGSQYRNTAGHGLDGWLGVSAMYADYRLIADFGWREETFTTDYLSNPMAIYISAMNRLDLVNKGRRSAGVNIPLRPELRPGYPVYIRSADCYYYIEGISHTFSYGGECTTNLTLVAKRAKFHAPGVSGSPTTVDNIKMDNPYLPATPIVLEGGENGPPSYVGFPNVVLALDPDFLNSRHLISIGESKSADEVLQTALAFGVIENIGEGGTSAHMSDGPWVLRRGNDTTTDPFTKEEIQTAWEDAALAAEAGTTISAASGVLAEIVAEVQKRQPAADQQDLINYLILMNDVKARVAPGQGITGQYRYYSCSHPVESYQGQKQIDADSASDTSASDGSVPSLDDPKSTLMFRSGSSELEEATPSKGIRVTALDNERAATTRVVQTSEIKFVTFAQHTVNAPVTLIRTDPSQGYGYNLPFNSMLKEAFKRSMISAAANIDPSEKVFARFEEKYQEIFGEIETLANNLRVPDADGELTGAAASSVPSYQSKKLKATLSPGVFPRVKSGTSVESNTVAECYGSEDKVAKVADALAATLFALASAATSALLSLLPRSMRQDSFDLEEQANYDPSNVGNSNALYKVRDDFLESVADGRLIIGTDGGYRAVQASYEGTNKTDVVSPVFPVSDEKGFEVYGSFPYGRGLSVRSYASLVQTEIQSDLNTLAAIEVFLDALKASGGDVNAARAAVAEYGETTEQGSQPVEDVDAALAAANVEITGDLIPVDDLGKDGDSPKAFIRASYSRSSDRAQSILATNIPQNVANIDPGTSEICQCKGAEAMYFLQAFSGEYAQLESDEAVQTFQEDEFRERVLGWELSKQAMAGEVRDTEYTSMGERFMRAGASWSDTFADAGSALGSVPQQLSDIQDQLTEDLQNLDQE